MSDTNNNQNTNNQQTEQDGGNQSTPAFDYDKLAGFTASIRKGLYDSEKSKKISKKYRQML